MNTSERCTQTRFLSELVEERLPERERTGLESHLETCVACQTALDQLLEQDETVARAGQHLRQSQPVTDTVLLDVIDRLQSTTGGAGAGPIRADDFAVDYLQPADNPEALGRLGRYEISEVIGSGGMGIVLRAQDDRLNRLVAVKVLAPAVALHSTARKRFLREAQAAAAVGHPNVVTIHSVDEDRLPYLVMEFVDGITLQQRLDTDGFLQLNQILRIGVQVAAGLAAAHAQGLVHRDIKPGNILLENGMERVKITDFGLARAADDASVTREGTVVGTPEYMSPEQARGESVDQSSDLFSFGSVLYTLATGRPPFRADSSLGVMRKITDDTPTPIRELNPEIPDWLVTVIDRLMSKDKTARFSSAEDVHELLQGCLSHIQQPTVTRLPEILRPPTNHISLVLKALAGVTAMITVTVGLLIALGAPLIPQPAVDPAAGANPGAVSGSESGRESATASAGGYEKEYLVVFDHPGEVGTLNVDIKRGSIHVVGYEGKEVIVKLRSPNYPPATKPAEDGLKQLRPNTLDFEIEKNGEQIKLDGNSYEYITNLEIRVPRKTNLILDSYRDGVLHVEQVAGQFNVRSHNNDIRLEDVVGSGRLWSYNGSLKADLKGITEGPLHVETYNGEIDLTLPAETKANARYRTGQGRVLTDFDIAVQDDQPEIRDRSIKFQDFVFGTLNGGGVALTIETEKGDIRLRRRMDGILR